MKKMISMILLFKLDKSLKADSVIFLSILSFEKAIKTSLFS